MGRTVENSQNFFNLPPTSNSSQTESSFKKIHFGRVYGTQASGFGVNLT